jgi:hypothetical protein
MIDVTIQHEMCFVGEHQAVEKSEVRIYQLEMLRCQAHSQSSVIASQELTMLYLVGMEVVSL